MNEKIKQHLIEYNKSKGHGTEDGDLLETVQGAKAIYTGPPDSHRHYDIVFRVVEVNGMYIGYRKFRTIGDVTPRDMGFNINVDDLRECEPKQITNTIYLPKESV